MFKRIIILLVSFAPSVAFAAGPAHGGPAPGVGSLVFPTVNFLLYLALIVYVIRKQVRPALEMRARTIEERIHKAQNVLADAEAELADVVSRLENVAAEKQAILEAFHREGKNIVAEVRRNAEFSSANIRTDVSRRQAREIEQARAEIRAEVVQRATEKARLALEAKLSEDDDKRLREEALRALF